MKLFVLDEPLAGTGGGANATNYLPMGGSNIGDAPRCAACGKFIGMLPLLPPVCVEIEAWGSQRGDVVFGPGDQILISDELKALSDDKGLVGFAHVAPVQIAKKNASGGAWQSTRILACHNPACSSGN